ncbi:MAG: N-acetyltransferase [Saprospiraceae bacterium]|nr:N-acetyltransferase [Pyrinomonadaceae bacterium]
MMEIQREEHGKRGAFFIDEDGEWIAEMTYVKSADKEITIDHTEVDKKLRGENIAEDLVAAAVAFARENGLKIKATCSYAKKVLNANADFKDVLG